MTKDDMKDYLVSLEKQYDDLDKEFQGVRPSYISTDLALLWERIERYKAMIDDA